jgi:hypothetical protein
VAGLGANQICVAQIVLPKSQRPNCVTPVGDVRWLNAQDFAERACPAGPVIMCIHELQLVQGALLVRLVRLADVCQRLDGNSPSTLQIGAVANRDLLEDVRTWQSGAAGWLSCGPAGQHSWHTKVATQIAAHS